MKTKRILSILLAVAIMAILIPATALADSGWVTATGYNDNTSVGDPGNAYASDDQYANFDFHADSVHYTFGSLVPSTAIIKGIQIRMEARESLVGGRSFEVTLLDNETERGSRGSGGLKNEDDTYILGGTTDKWDYDGWTADKINNGLEVKVRSRWGTFNAYLDHIQIRVSYSLPESSTTVTGSPNPSTYGQEVNFTATVNPAAATGTVKFYDGSHLIGSASVSGGSASIKTSNLSAGSHTIKAEYDGGGLYQSSSGTCSQTVGKADAVINVKDVTVTYDGTPHGASGTATGARGENLTSLLNLGSKFTNVPGGTASWSFAGDANHNSASGTVNITINKADAVIHVDGVTVTYDGAAHGATGTATGADGSNLTSLLNLGATYTNVPGGPANWSFAGDANHNSSSGTVQIVINKVGTGTTVSSSDSTSTYGQSVTFNAAVNKAAATGTVRFYDGSSLLGSATVSGGSATFTTSMLSAEDHTIRAVYSGDATYAGSEGTCSQKVNKANATIKANSVSKTYGETDPVLTATVMGAVNGETLDYSLSRDPGENAGDYDIYVTLGSGAVNDNYKITTENGKLTINKKVLTITANDETVTYGDAAPAYSVTYNGFAGSEDEKVLRGALTFDCSYAAGSPVSGSPYAIMPGGFTSDNYAITYESGKLTVDPKALKVTADNKTVIYGGSSPMYTVSYDGFITGEDETKLSGTLALNSTYAAGSNVGTYPITPSGLTSTNYDISFADGTLTVNKAALTVTAEDKAVTFLDAAPAYTAKYSGFVAGDTAAKLNGMLAYTCSYASGSAVGTYPITPSGLTSDNYNITFKDGTLTVNTLMLTVTFQDYNGTPLGTSTVAYGTPAAPPANPVREGYTFTGWSTSFDKVTSALTVTAQYAINTYTVRFFAVDGVTEIGTPQTINWDGPAVFPTAPARTGYAFDEWVLTGDNAGYADSLTHVKENINAVASYIRNGYTVTFVDYDGSVIGTDGVLYGRGAEAPVPPTRTGYTFTGWDREFDPVTGNITVTAQYEINRYTVRFLDYDGTEIDSQTVDYNTAATAPADPKRDGYTFTGWDTSFEAVTSDITVTAQYEQVAPVPSEPVPETNNNIPDEPVPSTGGSAFAWWWIAVIVLGAGLLFFLIFFVWKRRRKEEEQQ